MVIRIITNVQVKSKGAFMKNFALLVSIVCILCLFSPFFTTHAHASKKAVLSSDDIMVYDSKLSMSALYKNVMNFIKSKNLTVFAEFDHEKNAKDVNLTLKPTKVIVFGSPLVGTKLMQQYPELGLVLPLKVLLIENENGSTQLVYQDLSELFESFGVDENNEIVKKMEGLLKGLATSSIK